MRLTYQTWLFLITLWIIFVQGEVILENIVCKSLNKELLKFEKCGMKIVAPGKPKLGFLHAHLLEPLYNITIKIQFLKKSSNQIYNNYLIKAILFDACKFLESRETSSIVYYIYQFLAPYTNLNHSCPYMEDIYVRNFKVDQKKITYLPVPEGEYAFYATWNSSKRLFAELKVYITVR